MTDQVTESVVTQDQLDQLDQYLAIEKLIQDNKANYVKFYEKNNNSAGVRLRKVFLDIKKLCHDGRQDIQKKICERKEIRKSTGVDTPSAKAPSTKAPSTKAPSTKTPSTKTPSTKAPSTKTPAVDTPAVDTTQPDDVSPPVDVKVEVGKKTKTGEVKKRKKNK